MLVNTVQCSRTLTQQFDTVVSRKSPPLFALVCCTRYRRAPFYVLWTSAPQVPLLTVSPSDLIILEIFGGRKVEIAIESSRLVNFPSFRTSTGQNIGKMLISRLGKFQQSRVVVIHLKFRKLVKKLALLGPARTRSTVL